LREYTIKIKIDAGDAIGAMKPTMRAEAEIVLGRVEDAMSVPIQAVLSEGMVRYVVMPADGQLFKRVPIRLGRRSDRYAEVLAGVNEGDTVLMRNVQVSELVSRQWDPEQLKGVGLAMNAEGRIGPIGGEMGGSGRPAGVGPGGGPGGRPGEARPGAGGGTPSVGPGVAPAAVPTRG
jgi:hypothetical protein